ncbi:hypothetical protein ACJRO0_10135 [Acetobacter oryzifermentans]|uniref:hypothetical protein n=1 Tax=Acetobacter oryzifermentans TaxID=1633874 RepID=UPI0039BF74DE
MICPNIAEFDRSQIPSPKTLRSAPCEMRGVLDKLLDALKEMRSCVFRAGTLVLNDADIAKQAGLQADELERNLPQMIARGMLARDDENALFSTVMYDRLLRREERAARTATADADWQQMQESGDVPPGLSRKAAAARENGKKGGRKRNGETTEQYKARKEREQAAHRAQQNMMMPIPGGNAAAQKPTQETQQVSVSDNLGSVGSTVEKSNNIYKPNSSSTGETENLEPSVSQTDIKRVACSIIRAFDENRKDQALHAMRYAKEWLSAGASEDLIIRTIHETKQKYRDLGKKVEHLGGFVKPMANALANQDLDEMRSEAKSPITEDPEMAKAQKKAQEAKRLWTSLFTQDSDFTKCSRLFNEQAKKQGLPPAHIIRSPEEYAAYYRANPKNTEVKAA